MTLTAMPRQWNDLTSDDVSAWDAWQRSQPTLSSPYFRPEYVAAVAAVRPRTEVAVISDGDAPIGYFPYERQRFHIAGPVGGKLTDYQGIVAAPEAAISCAHVMRGCRLSGYHFNHLAPGQPWFAGGVQSEHDSPCLDIRGGLEGYLPRAKSRQLDGWLRKRRKLAREVGPLRLELHSRDPKVFDTLIAWKSAQYQRTGVPDVFSFGWTRELVRQCCQHDGEEFAGWLSALYAGDVLVAVDMGLRSFGVLHGWFPAYNVEFSAYAPGLVLNLELIDAAGKMGVECYDFGRGMTNYKQVLMTSANRVGEGAVSMGWASQLLHGAWPRLHERARSSSLKRPVEWLGKTTRSLRGYLAFR
jgi:CelD/BcsL family acetyltransferase involved in cellulose biosynthesis